MYGVDYDAERSGDSSDDGGGHIGTTVVYINGQRQVIPVDHGTTVVNLPCMRNLQLGDGQIRVINSPSRRPRQRRQSPDTSQKRDSSDRMHHSSALTDSKSKPTRSDLNHVCNNIGKHWKKLGGVFGLSRGQVEAIEVDFHIEGTYEMAYQTLLKWKRLNGDQVTICDLAHALDSIGMTELALELPVK